MSRSRDSYIREREETKRRKSKKLELVADIGTIPAVADPERRERCRRDLLAFLTTYFPASTGLAPFSDDHIAAIGRIQTCGLEGGLFCQAFPRGSAKTTISENAAIWAIVYGHRRFVVLFGADANSASGNIDSIKLELSENDLLYADFPEVCHPIRALEGKPQRCASQIHRPGNFTGGEADAEPKLTHIEWRGDTIVMPTIYRPDGQATESSGAIITTRGIMGGSRGLKHKRPDGTQQRPDLVVIDDPQTDESAATAIQVGKRLDIIRKNILKLGGHATKIAVVMNATVIRKADLVEHVMSLPSWQSVRIKMVKRWSDAHETLWLGDYKRLRETYDAKLLGDQHRAHRAATEFYKNNRAAMDAGADVFWEYCYDKTTELSAVQHAYNLLIDDGPDVFASECQNEPLEVKAEGEEEPVGFEVVARKLTNLERYSIPQEATHLVAFVDVQKPLLPYMVLAVGDGFGGAIVDYGTFPDQRRQRWSVRDARVTLEKTLKVSGDTEATIYAGLDALVTQIMSRDWRRGDGAVLKPERVMIDANWGESTDVVYQFCRQSAHAAVVMASHGRGVGASSRPFNDYQHKPGDRIGLNWRLPTLQNKRSTRYMIFDTNYWKTFAAARLRTQTGGRGSIGVFGREATQHTLLAEHFASERPVRVEAKGRSVLEWQTLPSKPDNHWWDCLVGCCVAASERGASLDQMKQVKQVRRRVSASEMQAKAKHHVPRQ